MRPPKAAGDSSRSVANPCVTSSQKRPVIFSVGMGFRGGSGIFWIAGKANKGQGRVLVSMPSGRSFIKNGNSVILMTGDGRCSDEWRRGEVRDFVPVRAFTLPRIYSSFNFESKTYRNDRIWPTVEMAL